MTGPKTTTRRMTGPRMTRMREDEEPSMNPGLRHNPVQSASWPRVPGYEVVRLAGVGGLGMVFEARRKLTGERVAIKVLRPELRDCDEVANLLAREAGRGRRMRHPHLLPVLDHGEDDCGPFLVTPWAAGGSLEDLLRRQQPLGKATILRLAIQIAEALAYAHRQGVVHADIKPGNILLDENGNALVADLGLSRSVSNDTMLDLPEMRRAGTEPYLSPAVAAGEVEDTRRDIYAFGALLYTMLAGRPPYAGIPAGSVRQAILQGPPEPIAVFNPKADAGLVRVAEMAMARDQAERYASMRHVLEDLRAVAAGGRPPHAGNRRPGPSAHRKRFVRSALATASTLVLAGLLWWSRPPNAAMSGRSANEQSLQDRRELLFADTFGSAVLDTNLWQWGHAEYQSRPGPTRANYQVACQNGSALLTAEAESPAGFFLWQTVWLDSVPDLRREGIVSVELVFDAAATNSNVGVRLTDGAEPMRAKGGTRDVTLWLGRGSPMQPVEVTGLRLQLLMDGKSGLVHATWEENGHRQSKLVDASHLARWRLRPFAMAVSAAEMRPDHAWVRLREVRAWRVSPPPRMAGWIRNTASGEPVAGVPLRNLTASSEAVSDSAGAFVLDAIPGRNRLGLGDPRYVLEDGGIATVRAAAGLTRFDLAIRKVQLEPGDVVATVTELPEPAERFALAGNRVYFSVDRAGEIRLLSWDLDDHQTRDHGPLVAAGGLAWNGGCLLGVGSHTAAALFERSPDGTWRKRFDLPTPWPAALSVDDETIWLLEFSNLYGTRCRVWGLDKSTGQVRRQFAVSDLTVTSLAAGRGRLWLGGDSGKVYEIDPVRAGATGRMEDGLRGTFPGLYHRLDFASGRLLALSKDRRKVFRLYTEVRKSQGMPPLAIPGSEAR
ncbi:MAG: serine/threonine protein kinase [Verrucomicrobia bacterium]|nr:MAG: serine/threonine protein kinase [Verrucomicrobiota bacterium]